MKNMNEKESGWQIRETLNTELAFLDSQESSADTIFRRLDQTEKPARRLAPGILLAAMILIILTSSVALAIGNWTSIAEWLGIKDSNGKESISFLLAKDDYVTLELTEAVTMERNLLLAVHAVPQKETELLCPYYDAFVNQLTIDKVYENVAEEDSGLTLYEYAERTGKTIRWVDFSYLPQLENSEQRWSILDDWYLQADGSVMIFYNMDLVGVNKETGLQNSKLYFMSLSNQEFNDWIGRDYRPTMHGETVQFDWSKVPIAEPETLSLDSFVQDDTGVELRDIRLYFTPHTYTLCYAYRVRDDSVAALHPRVLVAPVNDIGWVDRWATEEVEIDGEEWIQCSKVFLARDEANLSDWFMSVQFNSQYFKNDFQLK